MTEQTQTRTDADAHARPQVGDYLNRHLWSDVQSFRIIEVSPSGNQIKARRAVMKLSEDFKPKFVPGGFVGTVVNQHEQRWIDTGGVVGDVVTKRRNKRGGWGARSSIRYSVTARPKEYYDYNF